jgi:uncharacterized membrane protein YeaQ/YmgE (transglycosylase-associated protein family)
LCVDAAANIYRQSITGEIMDTNSLIMVLVIGALAGWLAGNIMKGQGFGIAVNIVVGIIGAVIGGFLFGLLGVSAGGFIGSLITATVGAVTLLYLIGLIKKV